mgnify:CR=1 FL=1
MRSISLLVLATLFVTSPAALAWNAPKAAEGPLTVTLPQIEQVTQLGAPMDVAVTLKNSGTGVLSGALRNGVTQWDKHEAASLTGGIGDFDSASR